MTRPEQILGDQYGLTVLEVERALQWARKAKLGARSHDAKMARQHKPDRRALYPAEPSIKPHRKEPPRVWCGQCERNVVVAEAQGCASKWCKAKLSIPDATGCTPCSVNLVNNRSAGASS